MLYHTFKLLNQADLSFIVGELMNSSEWIDGSDSARGAAKSIKRNIQLSPLSDTYKELNAKVCDMLMNEASVFDRYIYPKKIINVLFSRTSSGMYYGRHVDSAYTLQGRRDYSFTIFLNEPHEYDGGELILQISPEQRVIKLEAGSIIVYPTKYLHEVRQVTKGERVVCVGWIESYVKQDEERSILAYIRSAMSLADTFDTENHSNAQLQLFLRIAYQRSRKYFGD